MSQWTHLCGNIRYDFIRLGPVAQDSHWIQKQLKKMLGPIITLEYEGEDRIELCNLPMGSEGSARYQIWVNPSPSALYTANVAIWGDLRNFHYHEVEETIIPWFASITDVLALKTFAAENWNPPLPFMVRDAVLKIEVEFQDGLILHTHHDEPITRIVVPKET